MANLKDVRAHSQELLQQDAVRRFDITLTIVKGVHLYVRVCVCE
jgi:hypothetical protein